jgi:hypothetical protein
MFIRSGESQAVKLRKFLTEKHVTIDANPLKQSRRIVKGAWAEIPRYRGFQGLFCNKRH